ncbi:MAG TPA: dihydrolipoyl dehydrogenase [Ignavibacteria bacterium]|nr:dihydrolipoyl dehydrogenase [Ignavibacteria bacterium]
MSKKITILGAGPGGYASAFLAADLGMEVTLIDKEKNPGGVCLYKGCIPSKALLHIAKLVTEAKHSGEWGVEFSKPKIHPEKILEWKNKVVNNLTGGLGQLSKQRKINYIQGTAIIKSENSLELTTGDKTEVMEFENLIISTGSSPVKIPIFPDYSEHIWDSTRALDINKIPKDLLVVGGGYIGLELGTVFASLGSNVDVVEMTDGLLTGADKDLVSVLKKSVDGLFTNIMLKSKVTNISESGSKVSVVIQDDEGKVIKKEYERVLIAVGRTPNSKGIGLENAGIEVDEKGFIVINDKCETNISGIYAIGDVAGEPLLAHKASHQGRACVEVINGENIEFDPKAIPAVVFTDPEIAWTGLTETEAKEKGLNFKVCKFPWAASGRALTLDRTDGLTKIIVENETERIIGVGIVGYGAGELIGEATLAIEMGANVKDLGMTIHPHPTLSETLMESADIFFGTATSIYRPKRK